jgi:Holliday junction DNA helicase RuvA
VPDDAAGATYASDDPRSLARMGLLELGYSAQEADQLLDGADGETAEDLIAHALRTARS